MSSSAERPVSKATAWLTEGTAEQIVLGALQVIAFDFLSLDDPAEFAQDALHAAGFASVKIVYNGSFDLAWLKDGEKVRGAGDGTSAAIVYRRDGTTWRLNMGDEVRL